MFVCVYTYTNWIYLVNMEDFFYVSCPKALLRLHTRLLTKMLLCNN